jgi:hypothetical protein
MGTSRRRLMVLANAALIASVSGTGLADPPRLATLASFSGENRVVACDTLDEITAIAAAPDPQAEFMKFFRRLDAGGARVCEVLNTSGWVRSVTPLGTMISGGKPYAAWALELGTDQPGYSFFVLYVERPTGA